MGTKHKITIAKGLDASEISMSKGFRHRQVIDARCDAGRARPVEEAVLRRLSNHFIEYAQMPIDFCSTGPCQEVHLCETLKEAMQDTLVITDDLTQLSALLSIYNIEFTSNSFYIVETGKGEIVRPAPEEGAKVAAMA